MTRMPWLSRPQMDGSTPEQSGHSLGSGAQWGTQYRTLPLGLQQCLIYVPIMKYKEVKIQIWWCHYLCQSIRISVTIPSPLAHSLLLKLYSGFTLSIAMFKHPLLQFLITCQSSKKNLPLEFQNHRHREQIPWQGRPPGKQTIKPIKCKENNLECKHLHPRDRKKERRNC